MYHSLNEKIRPVVGEYVIARIKTNINEPFLDTEIAMWTGEIFVDKRSGVDITNLLHSWSHLP